MYLLHKISTPLIQKPEGKKDATEICGVFDGLTEKMERDMAGR